MEGFLKIFQFIISNFGVFTSCLLSCSADSDVADHLLFLDCLSFPDFGDTSQSCLPNGFSPSPTGLSFSALQTGRPPQNCLGPFRSLSSLLQQCYRSSRLQLSHCRTASQIFSRSNPCLLPRLAFRACPVGKFLASSLRKKVMTKVILSHTLA